MTCVGTPSGHPDQDKSRSVNVCSNSGQSTAGFTMLTTDIHTHTYTAHFIVPSRTRSVGTIMDIYGYCLQIALINLRPACVKIEQGRFNKWTIPCAK